MKLCFESDEIEVFDQESIQSLIFYKWNAFAKSIHIRGFLAHMFYVTILIIYVNSVYINVDMEN